MTRANTPRCLLLLAVLSLLSLPTSAQDWPNWRGPRFDGSSTTSGLPETFGQTKNVRFVVPLPGPGAGTPIVLSDRIYLSSVDTARERLVALCFDRVTGKELWRRDAGSGYQPAGVGTPIARGRRTTYASPSPVADKDRVIFFFGNGDLVAYDPAGKELWRRNLQQEEGDFAFQWTFSASPTLVGGRLFLPVLQRDVPVATSRRQGDGEAATDQRTGIESFILAIDPKDGKTLYRHVRPSAAQVESREAYATIVPHRTKDERDEVIVVGGDVLTGHDPVTGKELWRWGTWNEGHREKWWRVVPSAVLGDGVALVCAPKRAPVFAVKLNLTGELGDDALAWQSSGRPNPVSSDVPTPAYADGHFFVLSDVHSSISKVEAKTGKVVWTKGLSKEFLWRASPTVADGKIYCMNHAGDVVVLDQGSGEKRHEAAMGNEGDDQIRSSVVAAHGALFIRTNTSLFCIAVP